MAEKNSEFENFDRTMRDLMNVSHDEIKAELDAEKAAKKPSGMLNGNLPLRAATWG